MTNRIFAAAVALVASTAVFAQNESSSSLSLQPQAVSDVCIPYAVNDEGTRLPMRWGMDTSWNNTQNMRKGINHTGAENISIARCSFNTTVELKGDTALQSAQINLLKQRLANIDLISKTVPLLLNEDQEAGIASYYVDNGTCNNEHWANLIIATVKWLHANTKHRVEAIAPFNEPDYGWGQGNISDFKEICRLLSENETTKDIAIAAGNTLNCDQAMTWYNYMKPYVSWGTTHQLAGSFDSFANFFTTVKSDGNHGMPDEMHNVGEAMVAAEYGAEAGIWWSFDAQARGMFQQMSNHGVRLGYGENRDAWTAASVYRNDTTMDVAAFIGSSERQATTSSYLFLSRDREVYYDGFGPVREFRMEIPGGTAYQTGQTNAERYIQIEYGEDVPTRQITEGTYKIVNAYSHNIVAEQGTMSGTSVNVNVQADKGLDRQHWKITPCEPTVSGDYSYSTIQAVSTGGYLDVTNWGMDDGVNIMSFMGDGGGCEQWLFIYEGNGCWRIANRESNLYMETPATKGFGNVRQGVYADHPRQLWRIVPADVELDTIAPAAPEGLTAIAQQASVNLSWKANSETDLSGYNVLRAPAGTSDWNVIARNIADNSYVDNTCQQGQAYIYKVRAIDLSDNLSDFSAETTAQPTAAKGIVAQWKFDNSLDDATDNQMHAAVYGSAAYGSTDKLHKEGSQSVRLTGSNYIQLPYQSANMREMTFCAWVYWTGGGTAWQRIFDFGNGTSQYLFLTPSTGSQMRFAIKNGGDEQIVDVERLSSSKWTHVAVTISSGSAKVYVNGELAGENNAITITPADFAPSLNYIGRSQFPADQLFKGYIDDARIYNYALSASELQAIIDYAAADIASPEAVSAPTKRYDLSGRSVPASRRGIVIEQTAGGPRKVLR